MTGALQQAARQADHTSFKAQLNGVALVVLFVLIVALADYFWRHRHDDDDFVTITSADVDRWEMSARTAAMYDHPASGPQTLADIDTMRAAGLWVDPLPGNVYDWAHIDDERDAG